MLPHTFRLIFPSFFLVACSTFSGVHRVPYSLTFDEPQRLRFQGKGAGAGMMLSSSMGPMGVAIGVAIDEGIAKDIQAGMDGAGCALEPLVDQAFEQSAAQRGWSAVKGKSDTERTAQLTIQRLGFRSTSGDQDPAHAEVTLLLRYGNLDYALGYPTENSTPDALPLQRLKSDGGAACRMLRDALRNAFDGWHPAS